MFKLLTICAIFAVTLSACGQQKQASSEISATPKTILDKATNDINAAETLAAEQAKTVIIDVLQANIHEASRACFLVI
jgi:outer membrane lipoprotein-sorting protein